MKIVFFANGIFALSALKTLLKTNHTLNYIITNMSVLDVSFQMCDVYIQKSTRLQKKTHVTFIKN